MSGMTSRDTGCSLSRIRDAYEEALKSLLAARNTEGIWRGRLSNSALSTATATCALQINLQAQGHQVGDDRLVDRGLLWLAQHQNEDGGFGDTVESPSNVSTTTLAWASLGMGKERSELLAKSFRLAQAYLERSIGDLRPERLVSFISRIYGEDKTFSAPILTLCILAGRFEESTFSKIPSIPFELAALPQRWFHRLGLPMVSYALPALIAIGQARHAFAPTWNPLTRSLRAITRGRTLRVLESIQPESGGYLEATPLTSFVTMSLIKIGEGKSRVVEKALTFLRNSIREEGSWPIDTDLAQWVSSLSIYAISGGPEGVSPLSSDKNALRQWICQRQYRQRHPYTDSPEGGWAWTDHSGGVPDADDTPGALLALHALSRPEATQEERLAAARGLRWLLSLQNRDGGIPTFCRGWGKLPFDRSAPDLTAHTLRAMAAWGQEFEALESQNPVFDIVSKTALSVARREASEYLVREQGEGGEWLPLWFGNQVAENQANPVYGTTRVLKAIGAVDADGWKEACQRGFAWLIKGQGSDGGWGGDRGTPSTIEETSFAMEALCEGLETRNDSWDLDRDAMRSSLQGGCRWLLKATDGGKRFRPSPIGLYFAKLWYHEKLYPQIGTVSALGRAIRVLESPPS